MAALCHARTVAGLLGAGAPSGQAERVVAMEKAGEGWCGRGGAFGGAASGAGDAAHFVRFMVGGLQAGGGLAAIRWGYHGTSG